MRKTCKLAIGLLITMVGCVPVTIGVTDPMRTACPLLADLTTEEVLEGFVLAINTLRIEGLNEADALLLWVASCDSIPPDGNFQGDINACAACLTIIVEEVYSTGI